MTVRRQSLARVMTIASTRPGALVHPAKPAGRHRPAHNLDNAHARPDEPVATAIAAGDAPSDHNDDSHL
jgi:hypothetical protein